MTPPTGAPKVVAVASLTADVHDRFRVALQPAGHRVVDATTQDELLTHLDPAAGAVDLVVLDLRVSGTGVAGAETIRRVDSRVPIVIFAGSVQSAHEVRALHELGITAYISEHSAVHHILPALAPLLFPENFNRRTSMRVTLDIAVSYRHDDTIATALSLNLSKGGIGVRTMTPLVPGTKVEARFRLPGSQHEVDAACRVAWSNHRTGMGLQFEDVDAVDQSAIDEFVDQYFVADSDHPGTR